MDHAVGAGDIGTSGCRFAYLSQKTANVGNIVLVSFLGGPNILEPNEPAEMAIKKIGEGKFIKLFGWAARSATASDNTIKFPHLKALLDNSDANKPARFIILTNLEALAALGREMTENDLLYDFYKHLREVFREWCDSKGYPQPEEFFFAAPVVKNSALDANERGVFFSIRGGWNVCYVKLVSRMHVSQPLRRRRGSCRFCTMPGGKKEIFQGRLPWLTPGPAQCKSFP